MGTVGSLQYYLAILVRIFSNDRFPYFPLRPLPFVKRVEKHLEKPVKKGGVVGKNTESDCKELVVFYYLPENDRREFEGKWEP